MTDFAGPALKIKRAQMLLSELHRLEVGFWMNCNPVLETQQNTETGERYAVVRLNEPPPEMVHVLTAEIIYHLRSTLDQVAVRLAVMSGVGKSNLSKVYFPVGKTPRDFVFNARGESTPRHRKRAEERLGIKRIRGKIDRLDPDLIKLILRQKAYPGGNDAIYAIFQLANIDKHVELIPTTNHGQVRGINRYEIRADVPFVFPRTTDLYKGVIIVNLGANGYIRPLQPDARIDVTGYICFGNAKEFDGQPIFPVLASMIDEAANLLETITDYCRKTGRI